jgi:hypothetical protein
MALALGLAAPPAGAQPIDPHQAAAAQALFEQAQAAMNKKDYAAACPKLEEVTHLLPNGVGGLFTLAQCYEGAGRLASAWSGYLVAQSAAARAKRADLERRARERVGALKPKLAQLTITVPEAIRGAPGLAITRDDVAVGPAQWATPVPVDKGRHVVVVTATGKQRWEKEVTVPSDGMTVSVDVAVLADAPEALAVTRPASPDTPSFWTPRRVAGAAVGGVGLVGVVVGSAFGVLAINKKNESNDGHCTGNKCDPTGAALRSDGLSAARVSTGTFIAGALVLGAGVTLLVLPSGKPVTTGRGPDAPARTARVGVGVGTLDVSVTW